MGIFRKFFGSDESDPNAIPVAPMPEPEAAPATNINDLNNEVRARTRAELFAALGRTHDDVIAPIISQDLLSGAPSWPLREAHRIIETSDTEIIFATDGLTSVREDGVPGLYYELLMKVPAPEGSLNEIMDVADLFQFGIHRELAFNALVWPDLRPMLAEHGVISMVVPAEAGSSRFVSDDGQVGAIIAENHPDRHGVALLQVTLILPEEVKALEAGGAETRPALAAALTQAGVGWTSDPNRAPVSI